MHIEPKRVIILLSIAVLIASNLFLFGPFTVYLGNIAEFQVSFTSLLSFFVLPASIIILVLVGIGLLLPSELYRRYISITFIIGLLIWFQGNVVVWKYGLLDGQGIDWTKNVWRGWVDGSLWTVLLMAAFLYYRRIYKIAAFASVAIFSLQMVYLGFLSVQKPEVWKEKSLLSNISPPEEIYEFSSRQNVIHVVLDYFQSTIFQEIIDEDVDHYYPALDGFTFFKETNGSSPQTCMSIPAILSGQNYKNKIPLREFIDTTLNGKTIANVLYDNGYKVDLVSVENSYIKGRYSNSYIIPIPYGVTKEQYKKSNSALLLDLVLFRCAPHFLKKSIYNKQLWMIQRLLPQKDYSRTYHFSHKAFLEDLTDNIAVSTKEATYKFIHLLTTHGPFVVNKDCKYAGKTLPWTLKNIKIQQKCALDHFIEFLTKLNLLGIYESSLIVLHADNGSGIKVKISNMDKQLDGNLISYKNDFIRIVGHAMPLMAVKLPYSKGPLKVSRAQTSLTDIPATIVSILNLNENFSGRSMFEIDSNEVRERKYYHFEYHNQNWQDDFIYRLDEFIINGSMFDGTSWRLGKTYHSPKASYQTRKIDFGTKEASRFLRFGWSAHKKHSEQGYEFNWIKGSSASVFVSLPKNEAVILTANIKSAPFSQPQNITVKVDGKEIGGWRLSAPWVLGKHNVVIEPDKNRPEVSVVEFIFSQHRIFEWSNNTSLAALFESITLSKPTPYKWGSVIQFGVSGNAESYQTRGWSHPEDGFTWSDGQSASLTVPITIPKSHITLKANLFAFVGPGKVDKQTVEIMINGKRAGQWMITKPGVHEKMVIIPKSFFTNENSLKITFNMPDAISPAEVGHNNDNRVLGIAVCSIKLTESS